MQILKHTKLTVTREVKGDVQALPLSYGRTESEKVATLLRRAALADRFLRLALDNPPIDSLKPTA